ncbi:MAG TPA: hypothetical protein VL832_21545 [Puia sp.]|jgi:hypothetical protein|nr:hypothetical protein [Puia sp.]
MKKIIILSAVALLFSGVGFAHDNGGDKGKGKKSKPATTKSCPGKECGKKKGS